jgi:hypothetical protein
MTILFLILAVAFFGAAALAERDGARLRLIVMMVIALLMFAASFVADLDDANHRRAEVLVAPSKGMS